jgi:hypothetical protein
MNQATNQSTTQPTAAASEAPTLYCAYHPGRETLLRCNRCGQPMCTECAVLTEVGYRCKQCVRQQQDIYFNAHAADPVIAAVVSLVLGGLVGVLAYLFLGILGFFSLILAFFIGPAVGGGIAEVVRRSVGRRRARFLNIVAVVALVLGILAGIAIVIVPAAGSFSRALFLMPSLAIQRLDLLLFSVLAASAVYWRLR